MNGDTKNTSGNGPASEIPPEVRGWNWGAFLLNILWGALNRTYLAFLCFIPFANLVMPFVLGAKGNEWAWRNKQWESIEKFHEVQKKWAIAGVVVVAGSFVTAIGMTLISTFMFAGISSSLDESMRNSPATMQIIEIAAKDPKVSSILGDDIHVEGRVSGSYTINNDGGKIDGAYNLVGSKGSGRLWLRGLREAGVWKFAMLKFGNPDNDERIDLRLNLDESQKLDPATKIEFKSSYDDDDDAF